MLRWSPRDFREATVWEVEQALKGYQMSKGIKDTSNAYTAAELDELAAWEEEEERKTNERIRLRNGDAR